MHVPPIPRRVLDPQQKQTNADLAEHDRDEGLHPIEPADHREVPLVRRLDVVHVPPEPVAVFFRDEAEADQVRDDGDEHPIVVRAHVAGQSPAHEEPDDGRDGGERDEGPCCADVGGALVFVAVGGRREGNFFDHGGGGGRVIPLRQQAAVWLTRRGWELLREQREWLEERKSSEGVDTGARRIANL